jgi:hypothetical protein
MNFRWQGRWRTAVAGAALFSFIVVTSMLTLPQSLLGQPAASTAKSSPNHSDEIVKDLDEAIRILEKGDFKLFLELYAPVEALRKLRQQNLVDRAAAGMAGQPQSTRKLIATFKALKSTPPKFDRSGGLAVLEFDPRPHGIDEIPGELHLPASEGQKLTQLGSDLKVVLKQASKLLDDGDYKEFVEGLFPASEIARLKTPGAMQELLLLFQRGPDSAPFVEGGKRMTGSPLLISLKADLALLQTMTPEVAEQGKLAVFHIDAKPDQPARDIKFQLVEGSWRFFDNAERITNELSAQSKLKPRSAVVVVQMERVGGNWRFIELPAIKSELR